MDVATLTTMLCLAGFAGLSLAAAVTDVQSRRIPNSFVIVIALLFGGWILDRLPLAPRVISDVTLSNDTGNTRPP